MSRRLLRWPHLSWSFVFGPSLPAFKAELKAKLTRNGRDNEPGSEVEVVSFDLPKHALGGHTPEGRDADEKSQAEPEAGTVELVDSEMNPEGTQEESEEGAAEVDPILEGDEKFNVD